MIRRVLLMILVFAGLSVIAQGQTDPEKACRMEDGRLVFTLDKRWSPEQLKKAVLAFDLDTTLVAKVMKGEPAPKAQGAVWSVKRVDANLIELSKALKSTSGVKPQNDNVTMLDDRWMGSSGMKERVSEPYGINMFTRYDVFSYRNGVALFYLPGYQKSREVYLSGSFNDWSTMRSPMTKTDSGWIARVKLQPGKYSYKFIVDGRWTRDPFNRQMEDDLNGDYNSVVFCYNYTFRLRGHSDARDVRLAGSFNNWNPEQLRMYWVDGYWVRGLYLREGTHSYKFIVDFHWILDPRNKVKRADGNGNENSFIGIGDTLYFRLKGYTDAKHVVVAGNFNGWNTKELEMTKIEGGWELPYVLGPGNYEYKFLRDGKWLTDPANPYTIGMGDFMNSVMVVKPNYLFVLEGYPNAASVIVSGSFNGWNRYGYDMQKQGVKWIFPIYLDPGKYTYKFIVDGKWMMDPANKLWENNEYNTGNSVLWIEP